MVTKDSLLQAKGRGKKGIRREFATPILAQNAWAFKNCGKGVCFLDWQLDQILESLNCKHGRGFMEWPKAETKRLQDQLVR